MQNQRLLKMKIWENRRKPHFGPILAPFGPILGRNIFFQKSEVVTFLDLLTWCKNQKKLMVGSMKTFVRTDRRSWIHKYSWASPNKHKWSQTYPLNGFILAKKINLIIKSNSIWRPYHLGSSCRLVLSSFRKTC